MTSGFDSFFWGGKGGGVSTFSAVVLLLVNLVLSISRSSFLLSF